MMKRNNPEKLKFFLYSIIALIFVSITAVFFNYRFMSDDSGILDSSLGKPTISLDKVQHVATKDGVRQWSLDASVVNYYQNKKKAVFTDFSVLLFSENNKETKLTAATGELETDTNNITASGDVVVIYDSYVLETDKLYFNNDKRIINSLAPVKIINGKSELKADKMEANLDNSVTILEGNVEGILYDDFNTKNEN